MSERTHSYGIMTNGRTYIVNTCHDDEGAVLSREIEEYITPGHATTSELLEPKGWSDGEIDGDCDEI